MSLFHPSVVRTVDDNGNPMSGALWYFYVTGTTTPASIYTANNLTTELSNPVVSDAAGLFANIYLDPDVTYRAVLKTSSGATIKDIDPVNDEVNLDGPIQVSRFAGVDDVATIIAALNYAPDGATLEFDPGEESLIDEPLQIGNNGDIATAKNVRVLAKGHKFKFTTDGAKLEFNGPISSVLYLSANYTKGARTVNVSHSGTQLDDFERGKWIKIVSDSLDGWNRNQGTQSNQYRLGEWAQIRKVFDNGDGTATLTLWSPFKFTRGFKNTGSAEVLVEDDSYTTAMNARIFTPLCDDFYWEGGEFYVADADTHVGASGWSNSPLVTVRGFTNVTINDVEVGPGTGIGFQISGTPNPVVNTMFINRHPDNVEQSVNDSISTSYLGYGLTLAGCWAGSLNDVVGHDCRHVITTNGSTAATNTTLYTTLMAMGRTYGTRVNNPAAAGMYSCAIDTHHDAHAWVISNPVIEGTQNECGIQLRGPNHVVVAPKITGEKGIRVLSEWADFGGTDLGGLVGNGNEWMSSARVLAADLDVTREALIASVGHLILESGGKIRSRTHHVVSPSGGIVDFASGLFEIEITGESAAATVNGDSTQRSIFYGGTIDAAYGATWEPGVTIREGANVEVDAASATDTVTMNVFGQAGAECSVILKGGLKVTLPSSFGIAFANLIYREFHESATVEFLGNTSVMAANPKWDKGKVKIADLSTSTAQRIFTFYDGVGGEEGFFATMKLFVVDHAAVAALDAEYQLCDSFSAGSTTELTRLIEGDVGVFEAVDNADLSGTAPTTSRIGVSLKDGIVWIRHEIAATTYEDVFAQFTIYRQPVKA